MSLTAETIGMSVIFAVINLGIGVGLTLTVRAVTGRLVSPYTFFNAAWLSLSVLQGLTFQWWREGR